MVIPHRSIRAPTTTIREPVAHKHNVVSYGTGRVVHVGCQGVVVSGFCSSCGGSVGGGGKFCGLCGAVVRRARLGRFEAGRVLGRGWAGRVLVGFDPVLDRPVAMRLVAAAVSGDAVVWGRYRRALGRTTDTQHPNCVAVYGVLTEGDDSGGGGVDPSRGGVTGPVVVMRFVPGVPLGSLSLGSDPAAAIWLADGALTGVEFLHARGVAHGRVSAGNILVGDDGVSVLGDAGLAMQPADPASWPVAAPEQLVSGSPSMPADVYSFAASLWTQLAGVAPFTARSLDEATRIRRQAPMATGRIPLPMVGVLSAALAVAPGDRPTATELRTALRAAADQSVPQWRTAASTAAAAVGAGIAAGVAGATVTATTAAAGASTIGVAAAGAASTAAAGGTATVATTAATGTTATTSATAGLALTGKAAALITTAVVATTAAAGGAYLATQQNNETAAAAVAVTPLAACIAASRYRNCEELGAFDVDGDGAKDAVALERVDKSCGRLGAGQNPFAGNCLTDYRVLVSTARGTREDFGFAAVEYSSRQSESPWAGAASITSGERVDLVFKVESVGEGGGGFDSYIVVAQGGSGLVSVPAPVATPSDVAQQGRGQWVFLYTAVSGVQGTVVSCLGDGAVEYHRAEGAHSVLPEVRETFAWDANEWRKTASPPRGDAPRGFGWDCAGLPRPRL